MWVRGHIVLSRAEQKKRNKFLLESEKIATFVHGASPLEECNIRTNILGQREEEADNSVRMLP